MGLLDEVAAEITSEPKATSLLSQAADEIERESAAAFRAHVVAQSPPTFGGPGPAAAAPSARLAAQPEPAPFVQPTPVLPTLPRPQTAEAITESLLGPQPKPLSPEAAAIANAPEPQVWPQSVTRPRPTLTEAITRQPLAAAKIGLKNSVAGLLGQALAGGGHVTAEEQRYDPGLLDQAIESIFSLAADPITLATFAVGSLPGAVAGRQFGMALAKHFGAPTALEIVQGSRLAAPAALKVIPPITQATGAGGLSFAGYDAVTTTLRQIIATERGEPSGVDEKGQPVYGIQPLEIAKAMGRGAVLGGAMGLGGAVAVGGGALLRKGVEIGVLASVPPIQEGRAPTVDDVINAGVLIGGLTVAGKLANMTRGALAKPFAQRTPVERQLVTNIPASVKQEIVQEVVQETTLRTQADIAAEKARGIAEKPVEAAPEAKAEPLIPAAEAGLTRRGIETPAPKPEAVPPEIKAAAPTIQTIADQFGRAAEVPQKEAAPEGPLKTAREIAIGQEPTPQETPEEARQRMVTAAMKPDVGRYMQVPSTFYAFAQSRGRWPIGAADPGYMALRREWDELRRPLYEIQGPRLGQWQIVNRVSGEVEGQAPNRAMAQLTANKLDAARMAPLPPEEFKVPTQKVETPPQVPTQENAIEKGANLPPLTPVAPTGRTLSEIAPAQLANLPDDVKARYRDFYLEQIDEWRSGRKATPGSPIGSENYALRMREEVKRLDGLLAVLGQKVPRETSPKVAQREAALPVQAPKPKEPLPAEIAPAPEGFNPDDIDQLAKFVMSKGGIAASPTGDLKGEYAALPLRFKNRRGLSPDAMGQAVSEAAGREIKDHEILDRLAHLARYRTEQAARKKTEAAGAERAASLEAEGAGLRGLPEDRKATIIQQMTGLPEGEALKIARGERQPAPEPQADAERAIADYQMGVRDYFSAVKPDADARLETLNDPFFERFGGQEGIVRDLFGGNRDLVTASLENAKQDVAEGKVQEEKQAYGRIVGKTPTRYEGGDITTPTVFYHGTGAPLEGIKPGLMYLAPDRPSADIFASNPILNRGGTAPRVMEFEAKPGRVRDISRQVDDAIMERSDKDLDATIASEADQARAENYRYLSFLHPGVGEDYFRAIVSLYPESDLSDVSSRQLMGQEPQAIARQGHEPLPMRRQPELPSEHPLIRSENESPAPVGTVVYQMLNGLEATWTKIAGQKDGYGRWRGVVDGRPKTLSGAEVWNLPTGDERKGDWTFRYPGDPSDMRRSVEGQATETMPGAFGTTPANVIEGQATRIGPPRYEPTPQGEQAVIVGTPTRQIPAGPLKPEVPQRPVQETPLFQKPEQGGEQPRLPGVAEQRAPYGETVAARIERARAEHLRDIEDDVRKSDQWAETVNRDRAERGLAPEPIQSAEVRRPNRLSIPNAASYVSRYYPELGSKTKLERDIRDNINDLYGGTGERTFTTYGQTATSLAGHPRTGAQKFNFVEMDRLDQWAAQRAVAGQRILPGVEEEKAPYRMTRDQIADLEFPGEAYEALIRDAPSLSESDFIEQALKFHDFENATRGNATNELRRIVGYDRLSKRAADAIIDRIPAISTRSVRFTGTTPTGETTQGVTTTAILYRWSDVFQAAHKEVMRHQPRLPGVEESRAAYKTTTESEPFRRWFGESKVVDEDGTPKVVYRGDYRADLVGAKPDVRKAVSGRFYFTDDPTIASNYSITKEDVHAREAMGEFENQYTFPNPHGRGRINLKRLWYALTPQEQASVKETFLNTGRRDDGTFDFSGDHAIMDRAGWDHYVREARGNWLDAGKEIWLSSGTLFDAEDRATFLDILKHAGIRGGEFDSPEQAASAVTPVYLRITNPLDTQNIPPAVLDRLRAVARGDRTQARQGGGYDMWDKQRNARVFMERLEDDVKNGTTYAWTSVPEKITQELQRLGYDGIQDVGGKNHPTQHHVWIAFEPWQIKSAIGNKGTFNIGSSNIVQESGVPYRPAHRAQEPVPPFYLQSQRVIEQKMPEAAPAPMLRNLLVNGGVKAEEMKWVWDDFLAERGGRKVTKREALDFLKQNDVKVEEILKEGQQEQALQQAETEFREAARQNRQILHLGNNEEHDLTLDVARGDREVDTLPTAGLRAIGHRLRIAYLERQGPSTKFSRYTLPGAEPGTYRELLLTLPPPRDTRLGEPTRVISGEHGWEVYDDKDRPYGVYYAASGADALAQAKKQGPTDFGLAPLRPGQTDRTRALGTDLDAANIELTDYLRANPDAVPARDAQLAELTRRRDNTATQLSLAQEAVAAAQPQTYRSPHWDEPNVLAHVRFNDRTDAEGKRVLFIEEVQSDWHQEGRRKGYKPNEADIQRATKRGELPPGWTIRREDTDGSPNADGMWTVRDVDGMRHAAANDSTVAIGSAWRTYRFNTQTGIQSAPFAKTWHELAMKHVLRWAAESGYEKLAWTSGNIQAERYDLSKVIDTLRYEKNPKNGTYGLFAEKDGRDVLEQRDVAPEKLADYVGKDIADRIVRGEGQSGIGEEFGAKYLTGLQLKVGGEGMKGFYDQILPAFLNKYGKKWGVRVGETNIGTASETTYSVEEIRPGQWRLLERTPQNENGTFLGGVYDDLAMAKKDAREMQGELRTIVHAMDITPSMRASVMQEGQALFEGRPKYEAAPTGRESGYTFRDDASQQQRDAAAAVLREIGGEPQPLSGGGVPTGNEPGRGAPLKRGAGVTPLGALVGGELHQTGRVSFQGKRIESEGDLAVIGQVASHPQVESFRVVYVKGPDVLADEVISSRLSGTSAVFLDPLTAEQMQRLRAGITNERQLPPQMWEMRDRMRRLGADGYWLLHNHPAGTPKPTDADVGITDLIRLGVPGFKGHIVIDDRAYGSIRVGAGGNLERSVVTADFTRRSETQALPHRLIGRAINSAADIASLGSDLLNGPLKGAVAFYRAGDSRVRALEDVPYNELVSPEAGRRLMARLPEYGAQDMFIYLPEPREGVVEAAADLLRRGIIRDGVVRQPGQPGYLSLRDLAGPSAGRSLDRTRQNIINALTDERAIRVQEGNAPYGTDPALLRDLEEYGRDEMRRSPDFKSWSDAMRKEFGYRVNPYLEKAWAEIRQPIGAAPTGRETQRVMPPPTGVPPTQTATGPPPSGRGVLQDIDAMARTPEPVPWKERLAKAKERVIETQVNRFEPVRRLTDELKKLEARGLAQPTGLEPIHNMEIAKNRTMGQSQLFGGRLEGIVKSAHDVGLSDQLNQYLTLAQFDKRIRDLAARPDSEITPEGRTKDGGYVNPRQFDAAKVKAGFDELKAQTGERWPELEALAKRVWATNRDLLTKARDVGLVGQDTYDAITSRGEDYVPIQVLDYLDELGVASANPRPFDVRYQDVLRRMEGTERDVRNVLASSFDKGLRVIASINRNRAARAVTDLASTLPGIVDEVPGDQFKVAGDRDVVSAFYDGHRKNFAVPTDIARAMKFLDAEQIGLVGKILSVGKRPLQIGATGANLAFAIPNVIRDVKRAAIYSKYGVNTPADLIGFVADWVRGLGHVYRQDDLYKQFLESGAAFSTIQKNLTPEAFLASAKGEKPLADRLNILKAGINSIEKLNSMFEETTKLATFQRGLDAGAPIDQVAYEVANYGGSPNFGRSGSWATHLNLIWMFYNARLQGTAANIRRIQETPSTAGKVALARLGVLVGLPTVALWAWNQQFDGDNGMEQIPDGDRQRYNIILLPETYRASTGEMRRKYLKIPKEESEQVVSTLLNGFLDYWKDQNPQSIPDMAADVLGAVSPINFNLVGEPNANNLVRAAASGVLGSANPLIRTPVELGANYNAYYQGPLVPKSLAEHVRPTEQVRPTTSPTIASIAQAMDKIPGAEALGLTSPIKLQHAVSSSTGGLGQSTLDAMDVILAAAAKHLDIGLAPGLRPGVPETVPTYERIGRQALASRFIGTGGGREDRDAERRFYEALDEARKARGSMKLVKQREGQEASDAIKAEERPYVQARTELESIAKQLGQNYKRQIETTYYSSAPLEEREQRLQELAATHHRLMNRFRRREAETSGFKEIAP